jgi:hypothetical protein
MSTLTKSLGVGVVCVLSPKVLCGVQGAILVMCLSFSFLALVNCCSHLRAFHKLARVALDNLLNVSPQILTYFFCDTLFSFFFGDSFLPIESSMLVSLERIFNH